MQGLSNRSYSSPNAYDSNYDVWRTSHENQRHSFLYSMVAIFFFTEAFLPHCVPGSNSIKQILKIFFDSDDGDLWVRQ